MGAKIRKWSLERMARGVLHGSSLPSLRHQKDKRLSGERIQNNSTLPGPGGASPYPLASADAFAGSLRIWTFLEFIPGVPGPIRHTQFPCIRSGAPSGDCDSQRLRRMQRERGLGAVYRQRGRRPGALPASAHTPRCDNPCRKSARTFRTGHRITF